MSCVRASRETPLRSRVIIEPKAVIIAGTCQGATALAGRFLGAIGLDVEVGAVTADGSEPGIRSLHRGVLEGACPPRDPGVRRWGWTESEQFDESKVEAARVRFEAYATARRNASSAAWGFAEPRATLLLKLWAQILPDAVFVLVYRAPWDFASDMLASESPGFEDRPDYAARVWLRYAHAVIAFARLHPARCLVLHADAISSSPDAFAASTRLLVGEALPALADPAAIARAVGVADGQRLTRLDSRGPLAGVVRATAHEAPAAYDALQRLTDLPATASDAAQADPEAQVVGRLVTWLATAVQDMTVPAPADPASEHDAARQARIASRARSVGRRLRARSATGRAIAALVQEPPQPHAQDVVAREISSEADPAERWFREHYDEAADKTLAFLAAGGVSLEGKDVADIGSGDGIIDLALAHRGRPRRLIGYDLRCTSREHLAQQAGRYGVAAPPDGLAFERSEIVGVPADDDAFDVVVTWSAFEHISDPVGVAAEIRRILRPGGVLFLQLWPFYHSGRGSHLWDWFPETHHHLLEHEDDVVEQMLAGDAHEAGWTRYMADEFRQLNRITLEELHRSLLTAGFHVSRLELITHAVAIPRRLARFPLSDLAVGGVQLLAV